MIQKWSNIWILKTTVILSHRSVYSVAVPWRSCGLEVPDCPAAHHSILTGAAETLYRYRQYENATVNMGSWYSSMLHGSRILFLSLPFFLLPQSTHWLIVSSIPKFSPIIPSPRYQINLATLASHIGSGSIHSRMGMMGRNGKHFWKFEFWGMRFLKQKPERPHACAPFPAPWPHPETCGTSASGIMENLQRWFPEDMLQ